jgi:hypothetical protein
MTSAVLDLGQIVSTPGAMEAFTEGEVSGCLLRHSAGDWGEISEEDKRRNDEARAEGERLLSSYDMPSGRKLWIITEAEDDEGKRAATTVLLPTEY